MSFGVSEARPYGRLINGEDRTFTDTLNYGGKLHIRGDAQSPPHKNLIVY